jgi:hypothetical protein
MYLYECLVLLTKVSSICKELFQQHNPALHDSVCNFIKNCNLSLETDFRTLAIERWNQEYVSSMQKK